MLSFSSDPLREEDRAVNYLSPYIEQQAYTGPRRLVPVNLENPGCKLYGIHFLISDPAPADKSLVDTVVAGIAVARIPLILPAVVIGVNKMRSDKL